MAKLREQEIRDQMATPTQGNAVTRILWGVVRTRLTQLDPQTSPLTAVNYRRPCIQANSRFLTDCYLFLAALLSARLPQNRTLARSPGCFRIRPAADAAGWIAARHS